MSSPTNCILFENVTVSTSAVNLTTPGNARHVMIRVGTSPVRWRADGTAPTSTVGMYAAADTVLEFMEMGNYNGVINNVKFIRDTTASADAVLEVSYFD